MRMPGNREAGIKAMHTVLDAGLTYLNTGDLYDTGASELLVGCRTPEQV
jgi:aryl-alcohol dehydrogenase-like predicted oxidoreductase